ncbi:MAG TPA: AraC family transcriptional regulator [Bacilli bacterium]
MPIKKELPESKGYEYFGSDVPIYVNRVSESFKLLQHTHDFVEITYVSEGSGFHYIAEDVVPVTKGDLFFIPIGTSHVFRPASANLNHSLVVYNCIFQQDVILDFSKSFPYDSIVSGRWFQYKEQGHECRAFFEKLHDEYVHRTVGYQSMLYTLLIQLLVLLYRYQHDEVYPPRLPSEQTHIDKAITFIQNHFNDPLTVTQLAALTGLSDRQFYRLFTKQTGQTFMQYVQNTRINKSCELLRGTSRKIIDIANAVGYQDLKFFYAVFKKKTGTTPRQYRLNK